MAQSAEHILGKDEGPGSNPGISSNSDRKKGEAFASPFYFIRKKVHFKNAPLFFIQQ